MIKGGGKFMTLKEGGGNKLQQYNPNNGEYCRNPQCKEDEDNVIFKTIFVSLGFTF